MIDARVQRKLAWMFARTRHSGLALSWEELNEVAPFLPADFTSLQVGGALEAMDRAATIHRAVKEDLEPALADGVL